MESPFKKAMVTAIKEVLGISIVAFSDSHTQLGIDLPPCDIAIFAGDYSFMGTLKETEKFLDWFGKQDQCTYKVMICGNHEVEADPKYKTPNHLKIRELLEKESNIIYLENSGIEILGLKIWGSPITPWFYGDHWGFNEHRGEAIKKYWDMIPEDTDILVTHGPPHGILDDVPGENVGCEELWRKVVEVKPKLHIFGHIHLDDTPFRIYEMNGTKFVNASLLDNRYHRIIDPIKIIL